ncbi:MFS transporter [Nonomuraea lactucae]|uniref:MFS transporter n=1 Tax=Nonomuraea lactucae TaxID=2249762 RepID=UPI000DE26285|nr:MFS transporter [Nonomuraea lactucae]
MSLGQDTFPSQSGYRSLSRRGLIATTAGHILEWFDWHIYAIFSIFFAPQFFPPSNAGAAHLQALLIFTVGFFFRPLGAVVLGGFTDRHGRRKGLTLSVLIIASGSTAIAICPTYQEIGMLAPVILLAARMAQGFSTGGEFAAASIYLAEVAPPGRRGFYSSFIYVTGTMALLAATLLAELLVGLFGEEGVTEWAWRVPFAIGALLGFYGLHLRRSLRETGPYLSDRDLRVRRPTWEMLRRHPVSGLRVVGFTVGATAVYYTFVVHLPTYAQKVYGISPGSALWASIVAQLTMIAALPVFGLLSDRFGRKPLLIAFAAGYVVLTVPLFALLNSSVWSLLAVMSTGLVLFACYAAIAPAAMAELFPTQVRSVGLGMPYALTVAVFGGTAPYLVETLTRNDRADLFPWYVSALCLVSLVVYLTARETKAIDLEEC